MNGERDRRVEAAAEFWRDLAGAEGRAGDTAGAAQLRRCATPEEALTIEAAIDLLRRLKRAGYELRGDESVRRVGALAVALAWVREDVGKPLMQVAGLDGPNAVASEAKLKPGRFRRLLQSKDATELQRGLVRLVRLLKRAASVRDLAATILFWGDRRKRSLAFDYYAVSSAKPEAQIQTPAANSF